VGWSRVVSGKHHKLSRDLILELDIPGFDKGDRLLCALVARYHTKAMPDASRHRRFASLDPDRRELVEWLAGILRVADGLDCTHARAIGGLACDVRDKTIGIRLKTAGDCSTEVEGGRKKQDLLERKTSRRIEYGC
jgi:exopolyphosphatase/guanosine-5'-triphosphate,3'-diphosphate pyrophosphatase